MSIHRGDAFRLPAQGRILSVIAEEPRAPLHWLAMIEHETDTNITIYTRLSPQRLGQHLKLNRVEFKWLTENMDPHALSPSLERIHHAIGTRVSTDSGIIWLDAVEYLIHRQGFDAFLAFTRSLADELSGTEWTVLLPFSPLSMDGTEIAHLRREAMPFEIQNFSPVEQSVVELEDEIKNEGEDPESVPIVEVESTEQNPVESKLNMLSTIAQSALTPAVLSRRKLQWESMGFDVTELEYALTIDQEQSYTIYRDIEERIRRAIECDRRIQMIEIRGFTLEAAKMRFRIMQLTGLSDVESELDQILDGEIA